MPDLHQLLLDESSRLRPAGAPPFDALVRRHRRRSRGRQAAVVGACAVAVASVAVLAPEVGGGSSVERLAQPTAEPTSSVEGASAPPAPAVTFDVLDAAGERLPGNEWELVADPTVSVTVELSRTGASDMCLLFFEVLAEGGGSTVGRLSPPGGVTVDPGRFPITWSAFDPEQRRLPPGRYRLVANTQEQDTSTCGVMGYRGTSRTVQTSLGLFVVPP